MRIVKVPWSSRCLGRFNRLFSVDKSSYDGRFTSRLGKGYCNAHQPFRFMEYTFSDLPERTMDRPTRIVIREQTLPPTECWADMLPE
jgi:hypothetical protein